MKEVAEYISNSCNAGPKAKVDIEKILAQEFGCNINVWNLSINSKAGIFKKLVRKIKKLTFILKNFFGNDFLIVQVPFKIKFNLLYRINNNKVAIIHDIEGLRNQNISELKNEIKFFNNCKYIIAHNEKMINFLKENGVIVQMINLEIFDYLTEPKELHKKRVFDANNVQIAFAGNLKREKAPFLYQIDETKINFKLNVYGIGIQNDINRKILYKGKFSPDELPFNLNGDLGLVWDGNFDESDENSTFKNYTKYNNPHKFSCYMAAGIPVIVWKKSAIAEFVKKHNIGYTISNIYEINNIDFSDYSEKEKNVNEICKKVRDGYYTKKAIENIINNL